MAVKRQPGLGLEGISKHDRAQGGDRLCMMISTLVFAAGVLTMRRRRLVEAATQAAGAEMGVDPQHTPGQQQAGDDMAGMT